MAQIQVGLAGRDSLQLEYEVNGNQIDVHSIRAVGCLAFLKAVQRFKASLAGGVSELVEPVGQDHVALLMQELVRKLKGQWAFPYGEALLCKCRSVPTEVVDQAVVAGAFDATAVGIKTSAGTSCGTCKKDIDSIILYRLKTVS